MSSEVAGLSAARVKPVGDLACDFFAVQLPVGRKVQGAVFRLCFNIDPGVVRQPTLRFQQVDRVVQQSLSKRWIEKDHVKGLSWLSQPLQRISMDHAGVFRPQQREILAELTRNAALRLQQRGMKAVRRFNPDVGVRLVSFAVHWIKAEIHEYVLRNWRIVKVATTKAQRKLFFNLRKTKQRLGWFNQDEVELVARELGVTSKDVLEMESRMAAQDMTFDPTPEDDAQPGHGMAPMLYLQDKTSDFADGIEEDNWESHAADKLAHAMEGLDERSQHIIRARWLDDDNKSTLQELADRYGVSAERVRQLEKNAMKKLRTAIEA